jgi:hypothetical protein
MRHLRLVKFGLVAVVTVAGALAVPAKAQGPARQCFPISGTVPDQCTGELIAVQFEGVDSRKESRRDRLILL